MGEHQREVQAGGLTIIAEAATCHGGSFALACRMIEAAADAGATHVKFQHVDPEHFPRDLVYRGHNLRSWFEGARLGLHELSLLKGKCRAEGVKFLCTPQTVDDFRELVSLGIEEVKISSDNLTNYDLLREVKRWGGLAYLSTGMANIVEVVSALLDMDDTRRLLMVCTSEYPCPPESVNLLRAQPASHYGFSDHTRGATAALVALGMGIRVFEKHFRLDEAYGPDAGFAMPIERFRTYCRALRRGMVMLGDGRWKPTQEALRAKEMTHAARA